MRTIKIGAREWMTVAEAAEIAGMEIATIYKAIRVKRLASLDLQDSLIVVPLDEVLALWPQAEEATDASAN